MSQIGVVELAFFDVDFTTVADHRRPALVLLEREVDTGSPQLAKRALHAAVAHQGSEDCEGAPCQFQERPIGAVLVTEEQLLGGRDEILFAPVETMSDGRLRFCQRHGVPEVARETAEKPRVGQSLVEEGIVGSRFPPEIISHARPLQRLQLSRRPPLPEQESQRRVS